MHILAITNMYPTPQSPCLGTFVEQQVEGLRRIGLEVNVLLIDRARQGATAYLRMKELIRSQVKAFDPQIVHIMYGGVMADHVTRTVKDRPIVVSFCGSDLLGFPGSLVERVMAAYGVLASHKAARRAAGIVVKSRGLRDALLAFVEREKIVILPNGVDLERFRPLDRTTCRLKLGWDANRFHVLFPSHASHPRKRITLANAAVDLLNSSGVPTELVQLHGVPHDEVPIWLNAADVVILTSVHEGSPNTIKEALACDRPVVSVDVGDVGERIEGVKGCYLALPDPDDLAAKLRLVFDGPRHVDGRLRMHELSLEQVALRLKGFYQLVLLRSGTVVRA